MSQPTDKNTTVLIVEDDLDLADMIGFQLESQGYHILKAAEGQKGLDLAEKHSPGLIILDLDMKDMDGLAFCRKIASGENKTKYPVLVLTAVVNSEQVVAEFDLEGFMNKPFEIKQLLDEVKRIIHK